jgi:N-acetylmuramoyl-L-alanine amidase
MNCKPLLPLLLLFASCHRPTIRHEPPTVKSPSRVTKQEKKVPPQNLPRTAKEIRICIDAGHGGEDTGARTRTKPMLLEKNLTLKTALKTAEQLKKYGYQVFLTRRNDTFVPLPERASFASKKNCHLFVSIHYNSTPKATQASGPEAYYYEVETDRTIYSKRMGSSIIARLAPAAEAPSRGVHPGNFCVIRETKMPAVLIEVAFLSNSKDAQKLRRPRTVPFLGWAIAKGIDDYIHLSMKNEV